jgi:hypothetical protein
MQRQPGHIRIGHIRVGLSGWNYPRWRGVF